MMDIRRLVQGPLRPRTIPQKIEFLRAYAQVFRTLATRGDELQLYFRRRAGRFERAALRLASHSGDLQSEVQAHLQRAMDLIEREPWRAHRCAAYTKRRKCCRRPKWVVVYESQIRPGRFYYEQVCAQHRHHSGAAFAVMALPPGRLEEIRLPYERAAKAREVGLLAEREAEYQREAAADFIARWCAWVVRLSEPVDELAAARRRHEEGR
jgi:hypothetical protein